MKGQQNISANASAFNAQSFMIKQLMNTINTAEPVTVNSVTTSGDLAPAGFVSVTPLVKLVDGDGQGHDQSELFQLPYLRIQGGENAFVCDPKPGDIGLAVYAMRDTESIKETRGEAPANPGSARVMNKGDGFYLGGFLNALPKRYFMVNDEGLTLDDGEGGKIELKGGKLTIVAPAGIETDSPFFHGNTPDFVMGGDEGGATINANMKINGNLQSSGDQIAGGISQINHTHIGVQPGSSNTGKPE